MSKDDDYPPSTSGGAEAPPKSLLDRLSQALLGEPSNKRELVHVLREAQHRGLIASDLLDMVEGVFHVSEMQVRDIMVPRAQMDVVDKNQTPEQYLPMVMETGHSRFPMIDSDKDKVIGILLAKDLLSYVHRKSLDDSWRFDVDDILRPAVFVPESKRLNVLLREFRSSRNHMAIVVDEYGGVAGLVTIEDVLEQIVGEIEDEHDIEEEDVAIMQHSDGAYIVKALIPLEDFNSYFKSDFQDDSVDTIGGLIMTTFGHLPQRGEKLGMGGFDFEVLRADSRRIYLLKVSPVADIPKQASK